MVRKPSRWEVRDNPLIGRAVSWSPRTTTSRISSTPRRDQAVAVASHLGCEVRGISRLQSSYHIKQFSARLPYQYWLNRNLLGSRHCLKLYIIIKLTSFFYLHDDINKIVNFHTLFIKMGKIRNLQYLVNSKHLFPHIIFNIWGLGLTLIHL